MNSSQNQHGTVSSGSPAGGPPGAGLVEIDLDERGGKRDGVQQRLSRRLFMQLHVVEVARESDPAGVTSAVAAVLAKAEIDAVVYADAADPRALGLLTWSEDPAHFVRAVRPVFALEPLRGCDLRRDQTMFGRTYSLGHEPDLEHALLERSIERVMHPDFAWHVWYPLRRKGSFAALEPSEQSTILREHAAIGFAYGQREAAHDVRLASYGIDRNDNDFVIGLIGRDLHPLSHLVQTMRKTVQTSQYIDRMGPFFVGHVAARIGRRA